MHCAQPARELELIGERYGSRAQAYALNINYSRKCLGANRGGAASECTGGCEMNEAEPPETAGPTRTRPTSSKERASSKEREITAAIKATGLGDSVEEIYGPNKVADSLVWEVWVYDKERELATRFVEEFSSGAKTVYDTFQQIAVRLDSQHSDIIKRLQDAEWQKSKEMAELQSRTALAAVEANTERVTKLVTLAVASVVFILAIIGMLCLLAFGTPSNSWTAVTVLGSVIASACWLFYGTYKRFRMLGHPS
jgi:hypothetical protein